MAFDALAKQDIDTLRSVLFTLGSVLKEMQEQRPALRLDISQWPRVVIDVPRATVRDIIASALSDASSAGVEKPEPAANIEPSEPEPIPADQDWWAEAAPDVPDAITTIQDSALLAVKAATGVAAAAKGEMPRQWTEEEDKTALDMFAKSWGYEDIAVKLGRPVGGVKFRFDTKWKAIRDQRFPPKVSQQAAPVAAPAAPSPPLSGLTGVQAAISRRLDALPSRNGYTAKTDYDLVRSLGMGDKLQIIATDWGDDPRKLKARFTDICGSELPSPELQKNLLVVLSARISEAA